MIVDNAMSALTRDLAEVIAPLDDEEERRAAAAALSALDLRRPIVYGVELRIDKRRGAQPHRQIGVPLADLDGYLPHEVIVGDDGTIVAAQARPDLVPPFTEDEVAEAGVLARADARLAEVTRRWETRHALFYPTQHGHDHDDDEPVIPGRRLVGLHFFDATDPANLVPLASAVVDLTAGAVASLELH
jgi:hypothetical protein